jgi:hypothetical protein
VILTPGRRTSAFFFLRHNLEEVKIPSKNTEHPHAFEKICLISRRARTPITEEFYIRSDGVKDGYWKLCS